MRIPILAGVLLLALALILTACGGTAATPTPTPTLTNTPTPTATPISGQANVNISGFAFAPQTLRISIGTKVTWTNNDSVNHTVTSQDNLFNSGTIARSATFSFTFTQSGTFDYHCQIHPSMTGKIIVE